LVGCDEDDENQGGPGCLEWIIEIELEDLLDVNAISEYLESSEYDCTIGGDEDHKYFECNKGQYSSYEECHEGDLIIEQDLRNQNFDVGVVCGCTSTD